MYIKGEEERFWRTPPPPSEIFMGEEDEKTFVAY